MYNFARLDAATARLVGVVPIINSGVTRLKARIEALEAGDPAVQVQLDTLAAVLEQTAAAFEATGAGLPVTPPPV